MANNITFIIGNGLDLSLNLRTSYKHFYEYVRDKKPRSSNKIYQAIKSKPETWSDFELALGNYTSYIEKLPEKEREEESKNFHNELEEVRDDLAEYLEIQENQLEDLASKFSFSLTGHGFFEELSSGQRDKILAHLATKPTYVNFISLNYTKTLQKIIPDMHNAQKLDLTFRDPLHLHGDLSADMTIGVSDESQLFLGMSSEEKDDLIKPLLIRSMNDGRIEKKRRIIDRSSLVVLFGTSVGPTDRYIWEYLIGWLTTRPQTHLIIHKYDRTYTDRTRLSSRGHKLFVKAVQEKFLSYSTFDQELNERLKERIFVIHNTKKLFIPKP